MQQAFSWIFMSADCMQQCQSQLWLKAQLMLSKFHLLWCQQPRVRPELPSHHRWSAPALSPAAWKAGEGHWTPWADMSQSCAQGAVVVDAAASLLCLGSWVPPALHPGAWHLWPMAQMLGDCKCRCAVGCVGAGHGDTLRFFLICFCLKNEEQGGHKLLPFPDFPLPPQLPSHPPCLLSLGRSVALQFQSFWQDSNINCVLFTSLCPMLWLIETFPGCQLHSPPALPSPRACMEPLIHPIVSPPRMLPTLVTPPPQQADMSELNHLNIKLVRRCINKIRWFHISNKFNNNKCAHTADRKVCAPASSASRILAQSF